jgi:hypothetical protein
VSEQITYHIGNTLNLVIFVDGEVVTIAEWDYGRFMNDSGHPNHIPTREFRLPNTRW